MREMYFNSILIADIAAHKARFQKFEKGLNVVTSADNHVGKSSLLKSLYHSLGANVKYDSVWDINSKLYILDFTVDDVAVLHEVDARTRFEQGMHQQTLLHG